MARTFRFLQCLGEGSFGSVHLAEVRDDNDFVQTLAVKWLHERWSTSPETASRLRDEARLLALLRHESIVRVHGLTQIDGRLAILMEPVDGVDLSCVDPMPPKPALEVLVHVAEALHAAWSEVPPSVKSPLRVVHRDIKPSNIMVTHSGAVKVMDFGVARASFDHREAQTRSQQYGTARYMAPERWLEGIAESPSDIFSLGISAIELLSGESVNRPRLSQEGFVSDMEAALATVDADRPVVDLLRDMVAYAPSKRPRADEVAERAMALSQDASGPALRGWIRDHHTKRPSHPPTADLSGTVVHEDDTAGAHTISFTSALDDPPARPVPPTADFGDALAPDAQPGEERPTGRARWWIGAVLALPLLAVAGLWNTQTSPEPTPTDLAPTSTALPAPEPVPPVPIATPEPAPVPDALPAPEPTPAPSPAITPAPQPVAATPTAAVEAQPPEPTATTPVTFIVDEGLSASSSAGDLSQGKHAQALPSDRVATVQVREGEDTWTCTIRVGARPMQVRIQPKAEGGCQ